MVKSTFSSKKLYVLTGIHHIHHKMVILVSISDVFYPYLGLPEGTRLRDSGQLESLHSMWLGEMLFSELM